MNLSRIRDAVRDHPLVDLLFTMRGSLKVLVFIEPLWGIPYNLIAPFATLYMVANGVTDLQIGAILSLSMAVQVVFAFFGGIIADKLGRRTTTILGDFFGWSVACLVWALSNNFWLFLAAALLNSFEQINQTAWTCLLVEDAPQKDIANIYTWITIAGLLAVFFAPLSGLLINRYSLVPVIRVLYGAFAFTMLLKSLITWRFTAETRQGRTRMAETKGTPVWRMVAEYRELIPRIFRNSATMQTLVVMVVCHITGAINNSFFSLYVNTRLGLPERYLSLFPILRAVVMIVFMFGVQRQLERFALKIPLQVGLVLYVAVQVLLIVSPPDTLLPVAVYILLESMAAALVMPRKDTLVAQSVDPKERARIVALLTAFMIAFSAPFGYLAGALSSTDRRLPFALNIGLYLAGILVVSRMRGTPGYETDGEIKCQGEDCQ